MEIAHLGEKYGWVHLDPLPQFRSIVACRDGDLHVPLSHSVCREDSPLFFERVNANNNVSIKQVQSQARCPTCDWRELVVLKLKE